MQFTDEFADSVKSYNLEVHDKASETIYLMLNALQEAAKKFEDASTALDSNKNAHIEADYLTTTQKYMIMNYRSAFEICNLDIQKEVNNISDIVSVSLPNSTTVDKCESTVTFLNDLNTKVEELSTINVVGDLKRLLDSFNSMIVYMSSVQTSHGTTTYTPGDIANQSWYNDLETNTDNLLASSEEMQAASEAINNMPLGMSDDDFEAWLETLPKTVAVSILRILSSSDDFIGSLDMDATALNALRSQFSGKSIIAKYIDKGIITVMHTVDGKPRILYNKKVIGVIESGTGYIYGQSAALIRV